MHLSTVSIRRRLLFAPLAQHRGRTLLSIVAIALGVALEFALAAVWVLSGNPKT